VTTAKKTLKQSRAKTKGDPKGLLGREATGPQGSTGEKKVKKHLWGNCWASTQGKKQKAKKTKEHKRFREKIPFAKTVPGGGL